MSINASASHEQDVVDILTADHQDMLDLIQNIRHATTVEQRRDTAETVMAEIVRHTVAEEMHVYPVMEQYLPNGTDEVEHDKQEHADLEKVMKQLEGADAAEAAFMELIHELESQLRHHISDEEAEQFPQLRKHIPAEELQELGRKVKTAKDLVPTRPHPNAPQTELFHKTVGPGIGLIDRLRDKLTGRTTDE